MLEPAASYQSLVANFTWRIPEMFNIAVAVCDRHADGLNRLALIEDRAGEESRLHGFDELKRRSNRLANALAAGGIGRGDRVGILLGQRVETLLGHLAAYKLGAIAVPLFGLFGPDALAYRLSDSGTKALITDPAGAAKILPVRDGLPELALVLTADGESPGTTSLDRAMDRASDQLSPCPTRADDPALIIYTSGTTGAPKGALHAHRVLLGHLPGVQWPNDFFPQPGDLFWTPADWAWIGGLFDVLMPSLYFGVPVVAGGSARFDPERAIELMARHNVKNVFMPPTALRLLRQAGVEKTIGKVRLRSMASGGERLGEDLIAWGRDAFGLTMNEFYGQTEANLLVGNNARLMPPRPGSMGPAIPGHRVGIVDEHGIELPPSKPGVIALLRPDPVMFLRYWRNPEATEAKFRGDWLQTGDTGVIDEDGYITFQGRQDDVINSAGYRIGPTEIEECLQKHPAVAMAAVIGVPDPIRGEVVKACIVPAAGHMPGPELAASIQAFVRERLAAHSYPREVEFLERLPLTATGKIRRRDLRDRAARQAL